jgi:hypothetical protein
MTKRKDDPCWEDYEQVGMKTKDGEKVPNCVPQSADHAEVVIPEGWTSI